MKPNVIVALLLGLVIGFAVGKTVGGPSGLSNPSFLARPASTDESGFAVKSSDLPAGTFTDVTDAQKWAVMKVLNENTCDCGCDKGSVANCVKTDPNCPKSPAMLRRAITLAKAGKNADQIQAELFPGKKPGAVAAARPAAPQGADDDRVYKVPLSNGPILGPPDALVTIVEFSDYQCPYCGRGHETMKQVFQEFNGKVRLQMRQYPLPFHPFAPVEAKAAVAAGLQGKYWPMHEKMFDNQRMLSQFDSHNPDSLRPQLEKWAEEAGLDVKKFKAALDSPEVAAAIAQDQASAAQLGIQGTPAFFLNGRKIGGAKPIDAFRNVINGEIPKAEALVRAGVKPEKVYAKILSGTSGADRTLVEVPADAPFVGPKDAKVTIVEFSDFQCPYCSRALPSVKQIEEAYPKDVKVVFRHFPLPMHPNAHPAAEAAAAAGEQGKFWQMHDKLFANQGQLDRAHFEQWAQEIGLDVNKFKQALDSGRMREKVDADMAAGQKYGVNGTPTFFIDGQKQLGAPDFNQAKALIDGDMQRASKLLASGTKPKDLYTKVIASVNEPEDETAAPAPAPRMASGKKQAARPNP